MEYIIDLLQKRLEDELKAEEIATQAVSVHAMQIKNKTLQVFYESKRLAEERIPQLEKAILILKKSNKKK